MNLRQNFSQLAVSKKWSFQGPMNGHSPAVGNILESSYLIFLSIIVRDSHYGLLCCYRVFKEKGPGEQPSGLTIREVVMGAKLYEVRATSSRKTTDSLGSVESCTDRQSV